MILFKKFNRNWTHWSKQSFSQCLNQHHLCHTIGIVFLMSQDLNLIFCLFLKSYDVPLISMPVNNGILSYFSFYFFISGYRTIVQNFWKKWHIRCKKRTPETVNTYLISLFWLTLSIVGGTIRILHLQCKNANYCLDMYRYMSYFHVLWIFF